MLLMCKDTPVYDVSKNEIFQENLMPGSMLTGMAYSDWVRHRKSVLSNTIARKVYFTAFGYEAEAAAERKTHILSLSDCYWQKYEGEDVLFENISPYHTGFWDGTGVYDNSAIPTIYTSGVVGKYWLDKNRLYKQGCLIELEAYSLATTLGIPCNTIEAAADNSGIIVHNITDSDKMLEPAICSGRFSGDFFPTIPEIVENFGDAGLTMLAFDAVTGNTDRHLENFGFLRDAGSGDYLCMAPLYDFDQTLSADGVDDYLITQLPRHPIIEDVCRQVLSAASHPVFLARARAILARIPHT